MAHWMRKYSSLNMSYDSLSMPYYSLEFINIFKILIRFRWHFPLLVQSLLLYVLLLHYPVYQEMNFLILCQPSKLVVLFREDWSCIKWWLWLEGVEVSQLLGGVTIVGLWVSFNSLNVRMLSSLCFNVGFFYLGHLTLGLLLICLSFTKTFSNSLFDLESLLYPTIHHPGWMVVCQSVRFLVFFHGKWLWDLSSIKWREYIYCCISYFLWYLIVTKRFGPGVHEGSKFFECTC